MRRTVLLLAVSVSAALIGFGFTRGEIDDKVFAAAAKTGPQLQFACTQAKIAAQDPMFDPEFPHDHWFAGATNVDAASTYESLKSSPGTTCKKGSDTSAYWTMLIYEAGGAKRVPVEKLTVYYQGPGNQSRIRLIPDGQNFFTRSADWRCGQGEPKLEPPVGCRDDLVRFRANFPECHDGSGTAPEDLVQMIAKSCPASHPVQLPSIRLAFHLKNADVLEGPVVVSAGAGEKEDHTFAHANLMDGAKDSFDYWIRRCVINTGDGEVTPSGCRPGQ